MSFKKGFIITSVIISVAIFYRLIIHPVFQSYYKALILDDRPGETTNQLVGDSVLYKIRLSTVLVQSFKDGQLLQSGGGLVLTQDGLIVTLDSLVPLQADFYQLVIGDKLDRGHVIMRDSNTNLAIIAVDESGLLPVDFGNPPEDQKQLYVVNQSRELDKTVPPISQLSNIVTGTSSKLAGGVIITPNGAVVGILNTLQKTNQIIRVDKIEAFFARYVLSHK